VAAETALRMMLTGPDTLHEYPSPKLPFQLVNTTGLRSAPWSLRSDLWNGPTARVFCLARQAIDNTHIYIWIKTLSKCRSARSRAVIGGAGKRVATASAQT